MATKPISAEIAKTLVLKTLTKPAVFNGMIEDWPVRLWTVDSLCNELGEETLTFRIGPKQWKQDGVLWEGNCCYRDATLQQFSDWLKNEKTGVTDNNPLIEFSQTDYWCYADYKYMAQVFQDRTDLLQAVKWSDFGFHGRDGTQSTLWIGSVGCHTPCHYDTYGCNLVVQVFGQKTWHLFPPQQTSMLYPTRIPYEESSVFSQVNILDPDLRKFPRFENATPHIVTLNPGEVLFVPRHWWHFVECNSTAISINSWIELDADDETRVEEAITRTVTCNLLSQIKDRDGKHPWLNPTEDFTNSETNLQYLRAAVQKSYEKSKIDIAIPERNLEKKDLFEAVKTDCDGKTHKKRKTSVKDETFCFDEDDQSLGGSANEDNVLVANLMSREILQNVKCKPSIRQQNKALMSDGWSNRHHKDRIGDTGVEMLHKDKTDNKLGSDKLEHDDRNHKDRIDDDANVDMLHKHETNNELGSDKLDHDRPTDDFELDMIHKDSAMDKSELDRKFIHKVRNRDKCEFGIEDLSYETIVECLTHPSIVSKVAELLKDKCFRNRAGQKPSNQSD